MKEIDFLPEWYKESKRRRAQMRTQYARPDVGFCLYADAQPDQRP